MTPNDVVNNLRQAFDDARAHIYAQTDTIARLESQVQSMTDRIASLEKSYSEATDRANDLQARADEAFRLRRELDDTLDQLAGARQTVATLKDTILNVAAAVDGVVNPKPEQPKPVEAHDEPKPVESSGWTGQSSDMTHG